MTTSGQIQVHCIALAPPPVFRPGGRQGVSARVVDAIEIYINNCDIVPRLSLASIAHLLACLRAVDELKLSLGTQFDILIGEPGPQFPKVVCSVNLGSGVLNYEVINLFHRLWRLFKVQGRTVFPTLR